MAELADAIVQSGRETLERAIQLVEAHPDWRAQVVYGDTGGWQVAVANEGRTGWWANFQRKAQRSARGWPLACIDLSQ